MNQPQPQQQAPDVIQAPSFKLFYLRVSKQSQDIDKDKQLLSKHIQPGEQEGIDYRFFSEKISANKHKSELENLLKFAPPYSTIYITELSRLQRNTRDLLNLIHHLKHRKIGLQIERMPQISFLPDQPEDPIQNMMLTVISMVAQTETEFLSQRIRVGINKAKANGKCNGMPPRKKTREDFKRLTIDNQWNGTWRDLAKALNVSVGTIDNIRREMKAHRKSQ